MLYKERSVRLKRMSRIIFSSIVIYLFLYSTSCSDRKRKSNNDDLQKSTQESSNETKYISPNSSYRRDSLFIVETVWQFINKEVSPFHYYKTFNVPFNKITVSVDSIFYSQDSLKIFAFVIEKDPDVQHNNFEKFVYSGNALIGFRTTKKQYWKMYNSDLFSIAGLEKYDDVRNSFRNYYLGNGRFKDDADYYWDTVANDRVSIAYQYNIDNPKFWDSCIIWKKGSRIANYYSFQTVGNVKPGDENAIKEIPQLEYSDSIVRLYK